MPARKYSPDQQTAALDAVDALIANGSSVNKAIREVAADSGIPFGTIRGWRSKHGRVEPAGDRKTAAASAREHLREQITASLADHLAASFAFRTSALACLRDPDTFQDAARLLNASNAAMGTVIDKAARLGDVEIAAERVEVTAVEASPLDQLAEALDRLAPREDSDGAG